MRRIWLSLLLAFSLAFGGAANAWAAQACPYLSQSAAQHDCCPDGAMKGSLGGDHHSKKPADCQLGQACRASIAVSPSLPILTVAMVGLDRVAPALGDAESPTTPAFFFWRPPRTV